MLHFLGHVLGLDNLAGPWYGFWSGFFGCIGLFGTPFVVLRRHNCHTRWCPRIGRYPVPGTAYTTCHKHHPELNGPVTAQQIADAHAEAQQEEVTQ